MLSEQGDPTTATAPQEPAPVTPPVTAPQPAPAPAAGSPPHRGGWFTGAVRSGIVAAVVVIIAGAFFTIGWFTSTRGEHRYPPVTRGMNQPMNMPGGSFNRHGGMPTPQQGQGQSQGQNQTVPSTPSQSTPQANQQGYLGVGVETVTPNVQQEYGLSRSSGVLVTSVDASGPAAKAGIRQADVIVSVDGTAVTQREQVVSLIGEKRPGDSVSVTIDRAGQSLTLNVTLAARGASLSG